jgi:hypothetical protein
MRAERCNMLRRIFGAERESQTGENNIMRRFTFLTLYQLTVRVSKPRRTTQARHAACMGKIRITKLDQKILRLEATLGT